HTAAEAALPTLFLAFFFTALSFTIGFFAARELCALLRPRRARAGEHPRRIRSGPVRAPPDQSGVAIGGYRDAATKATFATLFDTRELHALLRPGRARTREHPHRAELTVLGRIADQRCVAVTRKRQAAAEPAIGAL